MKKEEGRGEKKDEEKERLASSFSLREDAAEGKLKEEQDEAVETCFAYIVPLQNQRRILMKAAGTNRDDGGAPLLRRKRKRRRRTIYLKYRPLTEKEEEMKEEKLQLLQPTKTTDDYDEEDDSHQNESLEMQEREDESDDPHAASLSKGKNTIKRSFII